MLAIADGAADLRFISRPRRRSNVKVFGWLDRDLSAYAFFHVRLVLPAVQLSTSILSTAAIPHESPTVAGRQQGPRCRRQPGPPSLELISGRGRHFNAGLRAVFLSDRIIYAGSPVTYVLIGGRRGGPALGWKNILVLLQGASFSPMPAPAFIKGHPLCRYTIDLFSTGLRFGTAGGAARRPFPRSFLTPADPRARASARSTPHGAEWDRTEKQWSLADGSRLRAVASESGQRPARSKSTARAGLWIRRIFAESNRLALPGSVSDSDSDSDSVSGKDIA